MIEIKPLKITESNFTTSIAEPDPLIGEAEWVSRNSNTATNDNLSYFDFGSGFVWGLDSTTNNIHKYNERFVYIESYDISAQVTAPAGIAFALGFLYVINATDGAIYKFNLNGTYASFNFSVSAQATSPSALAWDGNFFNVFDNLGANGSVYTYTIGGVHDDVWIVDGTPGAISVSGAASDGVNLYVNDAFSKLLKVISLVDHSLVSSFFANRGPGSLRGCAINSGRIFMSDLSTIYEYSTLGQKGSGYIIGEQVIKSSTHNLYESVVFNNDDPEYGVNKDVPTWLKVSSTNKFIAFDYVISTKAVMPIAGAFYTFTPGEPITNIGLFGMENITRVTIEVKEDNVGGSVIYSSFQDTAIASPIEDTIVNDPFLSDKVLFDDLPTYATPFITVTFLSDVSEIKVGDIAMGNARSLGVVLLQTSTSRTSYDTVVIDSFGNQTTVSRPSAEYTSFELKVAPNYADYVERILKDSLNKARIWAGDKPDNEKIFTFGYYERSPIVYSSPSQYKTTLKVRGLV